MFTPRLRCAVDELCGSGTWIDFGCGWWVITFSEICSPPWSVDGHWHVDGSWHTHYPYSKEVGLVPVMLFSDINPEGGGTAVACGSHNLVTDILIECGLRGCNGPDIGKIALERGFDHLEVEEITGQAGDVVLMHFHLLHARSTNLGQYGIKSIRYMCHPSVVLTSHLNFNIAVSSMPPVMRAVVKTEESHGLDSNLNALQYINPEAVESFRTRLDKKRGKAKVYKSRR